MVETHPLRWPMTPPKKTRPYRIQGYPGAAEADAAWSSVAQICPSQSLVCFALTSFKPRRFVRKKSASNLNAANALSSPCHHLCAHLRLTPCRFHDTRASLLLFFPLWIGSVSGRFCFTCWILVVWTTRHGNTALFVETSASFNIVVWKWDRVERGLWAT